MPATVLETPRLTLRPPAAEDLPGFVEFHSDAVTMEYLGGVTAEADTWPKGRRQSIDDRVEYIDA